jgi:hypothetical protein
MRLFALLAFFCVAAPAQAQTNPVHDAAIAYANYQSDVTELLVAHVASADDLNAALLRAARHDPGRVARGWIAYGGLAAAQSPAFVRGVRSRVTAASRAAVIRQLRRDMTYARRRPPGSAEALQLILSSAGADGARMSAAAHRYSGIGEAMDVSGWTNTDRGRRDAALRASVSAERAITSQFAARIRIGALAATPLTDAGAFGGTRFWDALAGRASSAPPALPWRLNNARTDIAERMFTIAGLVIVAAEAEESERVAAVLDERRTRECLELEQLQFRQCASVANDSSEDAHCLARHGLSAPGACFAALAAAP